MTSFVLSLFADARTCL